MRFLRLSILLAALLGAFAPASAQSPIASFPPGTFQNRAPLDATAGGGGTVTFDAKTPSGVFTLAGTSVSTTSINVSTGNGLLVGYMTDNLSTTPPGLGCTWDVGGANQVMTAISGTNTGTQGAITAGIQFFGLLAPTSGAKTLTCSWTGTRAGGFFAVSFNNVNQGSIAAAFPNGTFSAVTTAAAGPVTVTVTSATGHKTVMMGGQSCAPIGAISGTTITTETDMSNMGWASNYDNGAATVSMTQAFSGTCVQIASGVDVAP